MDMCACSSCCDPDEETLILQRMPHGLYGLGYTGSFLTFLLGIGLIATATLFSNLTNFAIQQWTLFSVGFATLIASVIATVGVQKRSATLNKLHLVYMICITLLTSGGAAWELVGPHEHHNQTAAIVVASHAALELLIIIIAFHRHRVDRLSFLESILEPEFAKASISDEYTNVYHYDTRFHD